MGAYHGVSLRPGKRTASGEPCVILCSPYHPRIAEESRRLRGHWTGESWLFDPRDEERVAQACGRVYGVNPLEPPPEVVTLRVTLADEVAQSELWDFGRLLVERRHHDDEVWLGHGVILLDGSFGRSGGSRKNPIVGRPNPSVTLEVRDVPEPCLAAAALPYQIVEDRYGADRAVDQRIDAIVELTRTLNPAARATLLLRLREIVVEGER